MPNQANFHHNHHIHHNTQQASTFTHTFPHTRPHNRYKIHTNNRNPQTPNNLSLPRTSTILHTQRSSTLQRRTLQQTIPHFPLRNLHRPDAIKFTTHNQRTNYNANVNINNVQASTTKARQCNTQFTHPTNNSQYQLPHHSNQNELRHHHLQLNPNNTTHRQTIAKGSRHRPAKTNTNSHTTNQP